MIATRETEDLEGTTSGVITAMVVDDEPLARKHLRMLLEDQGVNVVAEAEGAINALRLAEDLQPDLLFLDIQMPGLTGLQLAEALHHSSAESLLIFVTGYQEHAAEAFEHAAIDYLLKPVSPVRLVKALARARTRLTDAEARAELSRRLETDMVSESEGAKLTRLPIRKDYAVRLVRVEEIVYAQARDKRVYVKTEDGDTHRTYYTVTQLEKLLPSETFLRVHESSLVNVNAIEEILFLGNHTYGLSITGGEQIPVSRSRYAVLQQRLGLEAVQPGP